MQTNSEIINSSRIRKQPLNNVSKQSTCVHNNDRHTNRDRNI